MTKRTSLYEEHKKCGGKIVDFAGWEMPVQYSGVIEEHLTVRRAAGLFDVSHMGEVEVTGTDAISFLQYLTVNDVSKLQDGQAQYSVLCNENGMAIDDIIVYRFHAEKFLIVVNASNRDKDVAWIQKHTKGKVTIRDISDDWSLIALQGPASPTILKKISDVDLSKLQSFHFVLADVSAQQCIVARTGYTGEVGCEIFCSNAAAPLIWQELLTTGKGAALKPAGLGARDTLRLEMCYCLYGHELTEETNPLEAGLSWVVKLTKKDDFIGKKALMQVKEMGLQRKLVGFKMIDTAIPRHGYPVMHQGKRVGHVTSGTMSPSLKQPIGLAYVPSELATEGSKFSIDIRDRLREAEAVQIPFYHK
ncbi:MAG: glycine cleavage system protein T [Deltaproteobacteria bacterium RIFCSPLOWO2_02_FULL_44_10]|nr:MAG: glycine cleavage system protein T [Deltaproteobacteria bacterium RIFCSPLOWO2_02_FULL_44_10]